MITHDLMLEKQVVGALMLSPGLFSRAGHIDGSVFSDERNGKTWELISRALMNHTELNPSALWSYDRDTVSAIGGMDSLEDYREAGREILTDPGPALERLYELYQWRKITRIASRLDQASKRQDKSPEDILSSIMMLTNDLLASGRDTTQDKRSVMKRALKRVSEKRHLVTTGLTPLDFLMQGGIQENRLYGVGGLYGRGKTILLGSISDNLNAQDIPHLFISLETDPEDIELRNCAKRLNTNASLLSDPYNPEHEALVDTAHAYAGGIPDKTWYEFAPGATMNEIHRMILRAKARHGIKGFMLDYWQLIEGKERGQSEEAHHRSNANRLAALCRQEGLWGIITAQIDMQGKLKYSDSLLQAAALYVRMMREEDDEIVHFEIQKSNYTRYGTTVSASIPSVLFDMASGPHFRDADASDTGHLEGDGDAEINI